MRSVSVTPHTHNKPVHHAHRPHSQTIAGHATPSPLRRLALSALALLIAGQALATGPYLQDTGADGIVSLEVEKYSANQPQGGSAWTLSYPGGHSGSAALEATPNAGVIVRSGFVGTTPRLDYRVLFARSGTHYLWVRGLGPTASDNSLHAGLDGVPFATSSAIGNLPSTLGWKNALMNGTLAIIDVPAPGEHTLNLWMREDGAVIDKVVLTTNRNYVPSGAGPAASPTGQVAVAGTTLPVDLRGATPEEAAISYSVSKPSGAETATVTLSVYDADFSDEGELFINGNSPVSLFGSKASSANDNQTARIAFSTPASYWRDGANQLVVRHNRTAGFTLDAIEVAFSAPATAPSAPTTGSGDGATAANGANVQVDLTGATPEQFSVSLTLSKPGSASTALLTLDAFDADFQDEGSLAINGNPPLALFGKAGVSANDGNSASIAFETPASYWRDGENTLEFTHNRTAGFIIDRVTVAFGAALTASSANHPPTLEGVPATTAAVGHAYSFQPTAGDADGDQLVFSVQNLPPWATFSKSTGRISGTPAATGEFPNIRIAVSDGSAMVALPAFGITVGDSIGAAGSGGSVVLEWNPPSAREDGSPLSSDDIAGYTIYSGTAPGNYPNAVWVAGAANTSHTLSNLATSGTIYVVLTCVDRQGLESAPSAVTELVLD